MIKFFKKYHKWLGVIVTLVLVLFSVSGIVLNHRELFSRFDVDRSILTSDFKYTNWNNAAVKSTEKINNDSILIYGNVGIWLTDSTFSKFSDFNFGFPKGIDNKKVCKVHFSSNKNLFAGTFLGLYKYDFKNNKWNKIILPTKEQRITDIIEADGKLLIMTRSHILETYDYLKFELKELPKPENYDNKIGLFKTLWVIHSGEIYGDIGRYFVDFIALVIIFLSITGIILFVNSYRIKSRQKKNINVSSIKKTNRWNLKWHNKFGWTTSILLLITTITGMFLRPPLLIPIANSKVKKIPFTELASENPWFDKLRRILYDEENNRYIVATLDGFYFSDDNFKTDLKKFEFQAPASVMGVTVFRKVRKDTYLVGSFMGAFLWNPETGEVVDYIADKLYKKPKKVGPPIGKYKITGMAKDFKQFEVFFDYSAGAISLSKEKKITEMPMQIENQPLSLWNLSLEVHTGRIYSALIGDFYILIVPLSGLLMVFIVVSGFVVWYKRHRKKR